jgi:hypothetical protein
MFLCSNKKAQDSQCAYNLTMRRFRSTIRLVEKPWVLHNLIICICSLRYAMRMRHIVICGLPRSTIFFPHYLLNSTIFEKKKKVTENKMCFDFLYNACLKHFSLCAELSEIWSKMHIGLHVMYLLFLPNFNRTWIFLTDFRKILKYKISWKSIQWEPSCSMRTDRRTYMTKLIVDYRNFADAPNKEWE